MPIKRLTPDSAIDDYIVNLIENKTRAIIDNLCYAGERCINEARMLPSPPVSMRGAPHTPNYIDDAGNLRSSIGYVVIADGNVVQMSSFEQVRNGSEGSSEGQSFASQLAGKFPKGICLVVVAGMNYASYVSARGYDVLDSAELLAERLVPQMLQQLGFRKQ